MGMTQVKDIQKKYCSRAMFLALGLAAVFLVLGIKPIARGVLLGTLFSILNFVLMAQALPMTLNKNRRKTLLASLGSIWLRYAILAIPLVVAANTQRFNFFSVAAGLFMVQFMILIHHLAGIIYSSSRAGNNHA
jgi:hypothetical protein